jgi:hypothetical protein
VSEEENKALIRRWIEAFNERDLEGEADLLASGYVAHVPSLKVPRTWRDWRPGGDSLIPSWKRSPTFGSP